MSRCHTTSFTLALFAVVLLGSGCDDELDLDPSLDVVELAEPDPAERDPAEQDAVDEIIRLLDANDVDPRSVDSLYHETCFGCHAYNGMSSPIGPEKSAVGAVAQGRVYVIERILFGAEPTADSPGMPAFEHLTPLEVAGLVVSLEESAEWLEQ